MQVASARFIERYEDIEALPLVYPLLTNGCRFDKDSLVEVVCRRIVRPRIRREFRYDDGDEAAEILFEPFTLVNRLDSLRRSR